MAVVLLCSSLHEAASELPERRPLGGRGRGHGAGLPPGLPEPWGRAPAAAAAAPPPPPPAAAPEEAPGGAGAGGEGGAEEGLPTEALPLPQDHRGAGLPAQPEDQYRHQLVPQLQVSLAVGRAGRAGGGC